MFRKMRHRKQSGQSLILIALMFMVLASGVGLSVDVGQSYSRQRTNQSAANAAALAGMNALLQGTGTDASVAQAMRDALIANEVVNFTSTDAFQQPGTIAAGGRLTVWAEYLREDGVTRAGVVGAGVNMQVSQVKYVRVRIVDDVETYFARLVGRDTLRVSAEGIATKCRVVNGIYPVTFDYQSLVLGRGTNQYTTTDDVTVGRGTEVWIPLDNDKGNIGWVNWTGDNSAGSLGEAWAGGGTLSQGFVEHSIGSSTTANPKTPDFDASYMRGNGQAETYPEPGTWMSADPGLSTSARSDDNGVRQAIARHVREQTELILPLHSLFNPDYTGIQNTPPLPATIGERQGGSYVQQNWTHGYFGDDVLNNGSYRNDPTENAAGGNNAGFRLMGMYKFNMIAWRINNGHGCSPSGAQQNAVDAAHCSGNNIRCANVIRTGEAGMCVRYLGPVDMNNGRACTVGN